MEGNEVCGITPKSSASNTPCGFKITLRLQAFSSSRTLPGQWCASKAFSVITEHSRSGKNSELTGEYPLCVRIKAGYGVQSHSSDSTDPRGMYHAECLLIN